MNDETRRLLGVYAFAVLLLTSILVACSDVPEARLTLSPESLSVAAANVSHVLVRNTGEPGSILRYTVESDADWLHIEPREGRVEAGVTDVLTLSVRAGVVPSTRNSTIAVRSNAGSRTVQVTYVAGFSICADWPAAAGGANVPAAAAPHVGTSSGSEGLAPRATYGRTTEQREVLVVYHDDLLTGALARATRAGDVATRAGARLLRAGAPGQHDLLRLPDTGADAALRTLEADPRVMLVAPNVEVHRLGLTPGDPAFPDQWWAWCFGLPEAWSVNPGTVAPGADSVVLAVVDDGFNVSHRDLAPKLLPGYDFAEGNPDVRSLSAHGTHVAGIALALGDNGVAIAGTAYGADVLLLPVKVFPDDPNANGTVDSLVNGMRWAVGLPVSGVAPNPHPADVVNLSLGVGSSPSANVIALLQATLADLRTTGAVVVAAAGNRGTSLGVEYPARATGAIAVGAVDSTGLRSSFSTYGPGLDLMAPGGTAPAGLTTTCPFILSLGMNGDAALSCQAGTSMASPFVSGAAALLIAQDPGTYRGDPAAVEARLFATALQDAAMRSSEYGAGIACPDALVGAATRCGFQVGD